LIPYGAKRSLRPTRLIRGGLLKGAAARDAAMTNVVIPATAGIHWLLKVKLDPHFRGDDELCVRRDDELRFRGDDELLCKPASIRHSELSRRWQANPN
jgi:hypothetical protein